MYIFGFFVCIENLKPEGYEKNKYYNPHNLVPNYTWMHSEAKLNDQDQKLLTDCGLRKM